MNNKYVKFALVGGIGFFVDLLAMLFFTAFTSLFVARLLAFFVAVNSNWLLNRRFTFQSSTSKDHTALMLEWIKFMGSSCIAAIPNLLCYWLVVTGFSLDGYTAIIAIIPGIIAGMLVNFILADRWVFKTLKTGSIMK